MDAEAQIESFIAKFSDDVAAQIRTARAHMRRRLPGAVELVYDNYNALAIGYGGNEKVGGIVFSIAAYPRWISLFFNYGVRLDDPGGLLKGQGSQVRHIVLSALDVLDRPEVAALMDQALAIAQPAIDPAAEGRTLIKSIAPRQRPRRSA